jgi:Flp pilus assembly protein TadG
MSSGSKDLLADTSGVSAVEFALVGIAVIPVLIGLVDIGRYGLTMHSLDHATNLAARYAIMHGQSSDAPFTDQQISNIVNEAVSAYTNKVPEVTVSFSPTEQNVAGNLVVIDATLPFSTVFPFLPVSTFNLESRASLTMQN